jgi:hypothetical protein
VREPGAESGDRGLEALAAKLVAVVAEDALQPPAGALELARHAAGELRGLVCTRIFGADD